MVKKVAIVGAGPSGVLLAHYLLHRQEKYQIDIFDFRSDPETVPFSKSRTFSIVLSQRGINALRQIEGLEEAVKAVSLETNGAVLHQKNGKTRVFSRKYSQLSLDRTSLVIKLLEQLTIKGGNQVNLHFNHQCTQVDFAAKQVKFKKLDSEAEITVDYDLLIGADGARSVVRESFLKTENFQCKQNYVVNDYKSIFLPPLDPKLGINWQKGKVHSWRLDNGTTVLLVYQTDSSWSGVVLFPHKDKTIPELANKQEVLSYFRHNFPEIGQILPESEAEDFANRPVSRVLTVRCNRYHQGDSVLLIGDAAHGVSPSLGQGCNAALEDATIFNQILDKYSDNLAVAVEQFTLQRQADGIAVVELSDYAFPDSKKLFLELLFRNSLSKYLSPIFPKFFLPSLFELVAEGKLSYSEIFNLYQNWIAKVKKSNSMQPHKKL
ncbi:putative kynurenine 3-monooxygenase [Nostoc sp. HK-01]|uniref:Putative kynurenine 3-monooxygenase n=1 Tax=Anabaenopsis circularis NIES-21 TaxID=1085406 RepID=A0A1Z4GGH6_9CYAN|nr:putative kynurenine 3-monooxygenase [Anabaenopsis circularis NIES-21]BBD59309.1 putative kynurenine 3-monooxygenase [Nostoc sp. HK-01]